MGLFFLGVLLLFGSLFMMLLILVQRGKGGGLTGALGGMGGASAFGTKAGDVFTKVTVITSIIWITLCMITIAAFNPPPRSTKTADVETSMSATDSGESESDAGATDGADADAATTEGTDSTESSTSTEGSETGAATTDEGSAAAETPDGAGNFEAPVTSEGSANAEAATTDEGSSAAEIIEEEATPGEPESESTESGEGNK